MKNPLIFLAFAGLFAGLLLTQALQAQTARTGTNLRSKAIPSDVLMLHGPDEVETIRQYLNDGRKADALRHAEAYIDKIDRVALKHETKRQYYAWNAYCTVLTSLQRVEDAIAACSTAMSFEPGKWSAVNNRGTAKFVGGRYDEALMDYQAALMLVDQENTQVHDTIRHNMSLLEDRHSGDPNQTR
jgi:tetratricopeptide (TPR) repeat protein